MSKPKIIPRVIKPRDKKFRDCVDLVTIIYDFNPIDNHFHQKVYYVL